MDDGVRRAAVAPGRAPPATPPGGGHGPLSHSGRGDLPVRAAVLLSSDRRAAPERAVDGTADGARAGGYARAAPGHRAPAFHAVDEPPAPRHRKEDVHAH